MQLYFICQHLSVLVSVWEEQGPTKELSVCWMFTCKFSFYWRWWDRGGVGWGGLECEEHIVCVWGGGEGFMTIFISHKPLFFFLWQRTCTIILCKEEEIAFNYGAWNSYFLRDNLRHVFLFLKDIPKNPSHHRLCAPRWFKWRKRR